MTKNMNNVLPPTSAVEGEGIQLVLCFVGAVQNYHHFTTNSCMMILWPHPDPLLPITPFIFISFGYFG